jgi:hypothetical protein
VKNVTRQSLRFGNLSGACPMTTHSISNECDRHGRVAALLPE